MRKRPWSVSRVMTDVAILALGLSALLALRPSGLREDFGLGVLAVVITLILTAAADHAVFGSRRRSFWLGFTLTGWLCAAAALSYLGETRRFLLKHGPSPVRAREEFRQQLFAAHQARLQGVDLETPPVSEWSLLGSVMTEVGLGFALGALASSAGGLLVASVAFLARRANSLLHRPRPMATPGNSL